MNEHNRSRKRARHKPQSSNSITPICFGFIVQLVVQQIHNKSNDGVSA